MNKLVLSLISILSFAGVATAKSECYKNTADQNVKQICLLRNSDSKVKGFLLLNANGTKSYLTVYRETHSGYSSQEYGNRAWNYFVKFSDSKLNATDSRTSKISIGQSWEYSEGGSWIEGQTPGGRKLWANMWSSEESRLAPQN